MCETNRIAAVCAPGGFATPEEERERVRGESESDYRTTSPLLALYGAAYSRTRTHHGVVGKEVLAFPNVSEGCRVGEVAWDILVLWDLVTRSLHFDCLANKRMAMAGDNFYAR